MRKACLLSFALAIAHAPLIAADLVFQRTWGSVDEDFAEGVAVAPDGSVFVVGTTFGFGVGDRDVFLLNYAADGTLLWQRTWGTARVEPNLHADDFATDVAAGPDGSAYFTGFTGNDALLVKFDATGALAWQRTWGQGQTDFGDAVAVTSDAVYVTGATNGFGDAFLLKFSPDGDLLWQQTWGGDGLDFAHDIAIAADGSVYIAGETNSFFANDAFVAKFDPSGTSIWDRVWREGTIQDLSGAMGVALAADGSVYVVGNSALNLVGQNLFLINLSAAGDLIWERTWGDRLTSAHAVSVAPDGLVYVTGTSGFGQGEGDAFIVSFLPNGKTNSADTWGGVENDVGPSIAVASDGSVYVSGFAGAPPYVFDRTKRTSRRPDAFFEIAAGTVAVPAGVVGTPAGVVTTPAGNEEFGGLIDGFLIRVVP